MKPAVVRKYQLLADEATCFHPGCAWHFSGERAEELGEHHAAQAGHQVRVHSGAVVIFGSARQHARAGAT
jgi:hypothetical protein